jgi:hypothetical protein
MRRRLLKIDNKYSYIVTKIKQENPRADDYFYYYSIENMYNRIDEPDNLLKNQNDPKFIENLKNRTNVLKDECGKIITQTSWNVYHI